MSPGIAMIQETVPGDSDWIPVQGEELSKLLLRKFPEQEDVRRAITRTTLRLLKNCVDPGGTPQQNTGLVTGYVQSGKTLSFTGLIAAAQDNGFRIVVLVTGSKIVLLDQSKDRLVEDLGILEGAMTRPWAHIHSPRLNQKDELSNYLQSWNSEFVKHKTLIITILKQHQQIARLTTILKGIPKRLLKSALIIDDESDNASLNNLVKKHKQSTTYRRLRELRETLPNHTFLQYTATPQAHIFIPLIDVLSPDFCEVLEPGQGYVGGSTVFKERKDELVRVIPEQELSGGGTEGAQETLRSALRDYWIGVAAGHIRYHEDGEDPNPKNRSMMIHPSQYNVDHEQYAIQVKSIQEFWKQTMHSRAELQLNLPLLEEFRSSYEELHKSTNGDLPAFDKILKWLPSVIGSTRIQPVNQHDGPENWKKEWDQHYNWILIGGANLDRGFTVEGLTVTYMPRTKGGYSDTIQQRGRFFGYKSDYLGFCRIYLERDVKDAFTLYVEAEKSMRNFLRTHSEPGALKKEGLIRRFQMDRNLKPTRSSILLDTPSQKAFKSGWFLQKKPHEYPQHASNNGAIIENFVRDQNAEKQLAVERTSWLLSPAEALETHKHAFLTTTNKKLYEEVLVQLVIPERIDGSNWAIALSTAEIAANRKPHDEAAIIWMRPGTEKPTTRGTTKTGAISVVHQGPHPDRYGGVYKGDAAVHLGKMTLQVHSFDIYSGKATSTTPADWAQVTSLGLWLDKKLHVDFVSQWQRHQ